MLWENTFPEGYGRGALTEEEIFMPSGENDIIKISNIDGAIKDQITVMPEGDQPVGNLFSNGENIYIMGLRQVFSITGETKENKKSRTEEIPVEGEK